MYKLSIIPLISLVSDHTSSLICDMFSSGIQLGVPRLPKLANVVALCCKEALKFVRQPL